MQGDGYFLRVGAPAGPRDDGVAVGVEPPRARRRLDVHPVRFAVLLAVLGLLLWGQSTEGGLSARVQDGIDWMRGAVEDATTDPGLKRATDYFNQRYANEGRYPAMTEADINADKTANWGVGIGAQWCSPGAMVLQSLTGGGTVSRLLVSGKTWGEADGAVGCPADLSNPAPFRAGG